MELVVAAKSCAFNNYKPYNWYHLSRNRALLFVKEYMTFVREKISEEDIEAYGLRGINKDMRVIGFGNGWVIDRQRNIYLRWIRVNRENPAERQFTFYWKDRLFEVRLVGATTEDKTTGGGSTTWTPVRSPLSLPTELEPHREEVLQDLRDALAAYGESGMSSTIKPHTAICHF